MKEVPNDKDWLRWAKLKQGDKIVWWSSYCDHYGRVVERDGELLAQVSMDNSSWETCPVGSIDYKRMVVER